MSFRNGVLLPTPSYELLVGWVFNEMVDRQALSLADLAQKLAQMPSSPSMESRTAGAPFSMPYTLAIRIVVVSVGNTTSTSSTRHPDWLPNCKIRRSIRNS